MENIIQFLQNETKVVFALLIICSVLVVMVLLVLGKLNALITKSSMQQGNEQALLEKLTLSIGLGDKYQQQLQQQLSAGQQQQLNHQAEIKHFIAQQISDFKIKFLQLHAEQGEKLQQTLHQHQVNFNQNQAKAVDQLIDHLTKASQVTREEQSKSLLLSSEQMAVKINELTQSTDNRLKEISHQVEKRLADGFEKTTKTFNDILKR
jgi:DNA recombination protein RmuC